MSVFSGFGAREGIQKQARKSIDARLLADPSPNHSACNSTLAKSF
jgi:hypothetical protein